MYIEKDTILSSEATRQLRFYHSLEVYRKPHKDSCKTLPVTSLVLHIGPELRSPRWVGSVLELDAIHPEEKVTVKVTSIGYGKWKKGYTDSTE